MSNLSAVFIYSAAGNKIERRPAPPVIPPPRMSNIIHSDTIISGIVCTRCNHELPPMTAQEHLDGKFNKECPHTMEEWVMKVNEIDAWVMERFGKDHTWTLLLGGLTPDEEDKVYYRIPDLHVLDEDGTSTQGIAILYVA